MKAFIIVFGWKELQFPLTMELQIIAPTRHPIGIPISHELEVVLRLTPPLMHMFIIIIITQFLLYFYFIIFLPTK